MTTSKFSRKHPALAPLAKTVVIIGLGFAISGCTDKKLEVGPATASEIPNQSKLVQFNQDGKLVYTAYTDEGDIIPDFSYVGYNYGETGIPSVPVVKILSPLDGDNQAAIQAAIDEVSELPLVDGFRGTILLTKGTYMVGDSLRVAASGVVLRGEGSEDGTTLIATKPEKHDFIIIEGTGKRTTLKSNQTTITDDYVPVGAMSFNVKEPENLKVGSRIIVRRPSTAEWITAIKMDQIPPRPDGKPVTQWSAGDFDLRFDRIVKAINGTLVTIDAPLTNAFQREFGGGNVQHYKFPGRISNVGIEHLRLESAYDAKKVYTVIGPSSLYREDDVPCDEDHAWKAITFDNVEHGWANDVIAVHFGFGCVEVKREAKNITVINCQSLDPVSRIEGGRRYGFNIAGQLSLVRDSFSRRNRHDFAADSRLPGPNAFVDCHSEHAYSTGEPHHRWAAGLLYDNVRVEGLHAWLMANNRGWLGSGHGWAGAQVVFWNCSATIIGVAKPPTAQNFAIGVTEVIENLPSVVAAVANMNEMSGLNFPPQPPFWGDGYTESPQGPVEPRSLFAQQLRDRLESKPVINE
jgi:hypothetical protein